MAEERYDDEIWNEHQWEAHLNEVERKSEQLRKFIASDTPGNIPRWLSLLQENNDKRDAVDAFIEEELQIEEAYFPEEDEDEPDDWEDEWDNAFLDELDDDFFFESFEEEEEDWDEGEEWKELSDDFTFSNNGSIETLHVYNQARELAVHILQWAEDLHPKFQDTNYSNFVGSVLQIGAKLAGGYSFGFELDFLGGNIACTKKALYAANDALQLLEDDLKETPMLNTSEYRLLHEQLFMLRNEIGIYVQELRERFYLGFE